MGNLMNRGRNRLHLTHALANGNFLMIGRKIAVRIGGHCFKVIGTGALRRRASMNAS